MVAAWQRRRSGEKRLGCAGGGTRWHHLAQQRYLPAAALMADNQSMAL